MQDATKYKVLILLTAVISFTGCRKVFDLPEEVDYLSTKADYNTKIFTPRLGRTSVTVNAFNPDASSFPMTFTIQNARFGDGRDASDMMAVKPTLIWASEYTGQEKTLAEIENKRRIENRPMVELRGSGDLIMWYTATRDLIKPSDSVTYPQDIRYFDVKISNSGGSRVIKNLQIIPRIDVPYEPSDDYNTINGKPNTTTPGGKVRVFNYPSISGIKGATTNVAMNDPKNPTTGRVYLYIRKFSNDANGHRLRFKFLNKDSVAMNPLLFNETKWLEQVHGFNEAGTELGYKMTTEYVEYNVAYPIPLARIPTRFTAGGATGSGDMAHVEFTFSRVGFGGVREFGKLSKDFKIYEKGDWEIVFHFKDINPKFDND
ncbi:DUF5007 domain-containing protein [Pedobacter frigoris]|uniref:DUF5007 domain-containing protein n=1 Tax=Pedobacter frigoris TaxID=2571272 RepID=A0A4U1CQK6_9SPHI|nr:DUF5007 domain-containing protein [Pedobacter frigoris]TKC09180.1 DUF5007 domain-containing protein [Pedobacter frigoris]